MQPGKASKTTEIMWVSALITGMFVAIFLLGYLFLRLAGVAGLESAAKWAEADYAWWLLALAGMFLATFAALPNLFAAVVLVLLSRRWDWANSPIVWALVAMATIQVLAVPYGFGEAREAGGFAYSQWLTGSLSGLLAGLAGRHGLTLARRQTSSRNASTTAR